MFTDGAAHHSPCALTTWLTFHHLIPLWQISLMSSKFKNQARPTLLMKKSPTQRCPCSWTSLEQRRRCSWTSHTHQVSGQEVSAKIWLIVHHAAAIVNMSLTLTFLPSHPTVKDFYHSRTGGGSTRLTLRGYKLWISEPHRNGMRGPSKLCNATWKAQNWQLYLPVWPAVLPWGGL